MAYSKALFRSLKPKEAPGSESSVEHAIGSGTSAKLNLEARRGASDLLTEVRLRLDIAIRRPIVFTCHVKRFVEESNTC